MKFFGTAIILATMIFVSNSHAGAWYTGVVNRVALYDKNGSFIITYKPSATNATSIDDCQHKYVHFDYEKLGEGRLRHAYSMALTSLTAQLTMGAVIDKAVNGSGGSCYAVGMTAELKSN